MAAIVKAALDKAKKQTIDEIRSALNKADEKHPKKIGKKISEQLSLFSLQDIASDIQDDLSDIAAEGGELWLAQVKVPNKEELFDKVNDRAVIYARDRGVELVSGVDDATRDEMARLIAKGLEDNIGMDAIADNIANGYAFSAERSELIARTEIGNANQNGVLSGMKEARDAGVKLGKFWIPDDQACDDCLANADDGVIGLDEDFSSGDDAPLAHPRCFIGSTSVSAFGVSKAYRRWFEGEVITINIGATNFTTTSNHPILTDRGFVLAKSLKIGDSLVQFPQGNLSSQINPNNDYIETRIEQIFNALSMSSGSTTSRMPTAAEHFHGDGIANGEVDIINTASSLHSNVIMGVKNEKIENNLFSLCESDRSTLPSKSILEQNLFWNRNSTDCVVGGFDSSKSSFTSRNSGFSKLSLALCPDGQIKRFESSTQRSACIVSDSFSESYATFASQIRLVQITDLLVSQFSGHVYNLETADGWYIAESIIASNCECTIGSEIIEDTKSNENQNTSEEE